MKVYDLIRRRYLAQFLPHLEMDKTVATLQSSGHTLVARGNVIVAQGWRILFGKMWMRKLVMMMRNKDYLY